MSLFGREMETDASIADQFFESLLSLGLPSKLLIHELVQEHPSRVLVVVSGGVEDSIEPVLAIPARGDAIRGAVVPTIGPQHRYAFELTHLGEA